MEKQSTNTITQERKNSLLITDIVFREIGITEENKNDSEDSLIKQYSKEHLPVSKLLRECAKVISLYTKDCPDSLCNKLIEECKAWDLADEEIEIIYEHISYNS